MSERRKFLQKASGAMVAVAASTIVDAPNVIAQPKVQWRMSTAWPKLMDLGQVPAQQMAKIVEEMSGGRFRIEVFPGARSYRRSTASTPPRRALSRRSWPSRPTGQNPRGSPRSSGS